MFEATFKFYRRSLLQEQYIVPNFKISKQNVQENIYKMTGLRQGFQVKYFDPQNDPITAVEEDDYSIAAEQIIDGTVVFQVDIIKDQSKINYSEEFKIKFQGDNPDEFSDELQIQKSENGNNSEEKQAKDIQDLQEEQFEEKEEEKEQTIISQKQKSCNLIRGTRVDSIVAIQVKDDDIQETQNDNNTAGKINTMNTAQKENQNLSAQQNVRQFIQPQNQQLLSPKNDNVSQQKVDPLVGEQVLQKKQKSQRRKQAQITNIQAICNEQESKLNFRIEQNQTLSKIFDYVKVRLSEILKETCFKQSQKIIQTELNQHEQSIKKDQQQLISFPCKSCHKLIAYLPFFVSQNNEFLCSKCEQVDQKGQLLIKVRNINDAMKLKTVKIFDLWGKQKIDE